MEIIEFFIYFVVLLLLCPLTWVMALQFVILVIWDRPRPEPFQGSPRLEEELARAFWEEEPDGDGQHAPVLPSEAGRYRPAITAAFGYVAACMVLIGLALVLESRTDRRRAGPCGCSSGSSLRS